MSSSPVTAALDSYCDNGALDESQIETVVRPPYFGQYRWALHFAPTVYNWTQFDSLHLRLLTALRPFEVRLVHSRHALFFSLYGTDSGALDAVLPFVDEFDFHAMRLVAADCWGWSLPKPKPKGLYYHRYGFRVRLQSPLDQSDKDRIRDVEVDVMISNGKTAFVYCKDVRDVILVKLMCSDNIREICDRSDLESYESKRRSA